MVSKLLQNSLDKAYGKEGNPGSPGWANSWPDLLHGGMGTEPPQLCQGLGWVQWGPVWSFC